MTFCALLFLVVSFATPIPIWAADGEPFSDLNVNDPLSLHEANRVLEEELRLAARPQTYLLIDLVSPSIHVKARGVTLHRIPIRSWSARSSDLMTGVFRILARPAVNRRKIDPTTTVEQEPISLADMPVQYHMSCTPELTLAVLPTASDHPFQWTLISSQIWWQQLKDWGQALFGGAQDARRPYLRLTLATDQARSLAWSLVDGMPVVIRRPTAK